MNANMYIRVLLNHIIPPVCRLIQESYIFQHDNDSKRTTKKVKNIFPVRISDFWTGQAKALILTILKIFSTNWKF